MKRRISKRVVKPALMYCSETWSITKAQERKLEGAEMKILRLIFDITRRDRVRNQWVEGHLKVGLCKETFKKVDYDGLDTLTHRRYKNYVGIGYCDEENW